MLHFLIRLLNRLARKLGWIHHYHHAHGMTSLHDIYCCMIGFAPQRYIQYRLHENDRNQYISTKTRFFGLPRVHGEHMVALRDKSAFNAILKQAGFEKHLPKRYEQFQLNSTMTAQIEDGTYIMKPERGSSGKGVRLVESRNGELVTAQDTDSKPSDVSDDVFILEECIQNAEYAQGIFDQSLNTIRFMTAWDYESDRPFIPAAAHRFGTQASAPTDNISRGGILAPLNVQNGQLGPALTFNADGTVTRSTTHPDTDASIEGLYVPQWDTLKAFVIEVASHMPYCPCAGWDVALGANEQFVIIEANPTPDLSLIQTHTPLLSDSGVRKFLGHYNLP